MNKKELIVKISQISGVESSDCCQVIEALEIVLSEELETSSSIRNVFGKVYKLMGILKK